MTIQEYIHFSSFVDYMYMSDEQIKEMHELDKKYKEDKEFQKKVKEEYGKKDYEKYKHKQTYYK